MQIIKLHHPLKEQGMSAVLYDEDTEKMHNIITDFFIEALKREGLREKMLGSMQLRIHELAAENQELQDKIKKSAKNCQQNTKSLDKTWIETE